MRWYKKVLIILAASGLLALFIFFGLRITTVEVQGSKIYSQKEIKDSVFTRKYADNELFFWIYNKLFGINKLPFVEDIEVEYNGWHKVTLQVYDKTISGCIKYMGQYVYFDKDGIVLQSMTTRREEVPVVTGIRFGTFSIGKAFNVKDSSLFETIMNLSQLIAHYKIKVERIHVEQNRMVLFTGNVKVYLAKKSIYDDELSALSSVLQTVEEKNLSGTINMEGFKRGDKIILKQPVKKSAKKKKS